MVKLTEEQGERLDKLIDLIITDRASLAEKVEAGRLSDIFMRSIEGSQRNV